jgi:hypothetical protein
MGVFPKKTTHSSRPPNRTATRACAALSLSSLNKIYARRLHQRERQSNKTVRMNLGTMKDELLRARLSFRVPRSHFILVVYSDGRGPASMPRTLA